MSDSRSNNLLTISVVISAYNAEKTMKRCLDSLLVSQYNAFEVIVVDDGSTDRTSEIVKEYMQKDYRIKLISQPNAGPSAARNRGIDHVTGEIVAFVDSDDYVASDYFAELAYAFETSKADVVFFEFVRVNEKGSVISTHRLPEYTSEWDELLIRLSDADMFGYTWCKAFRKEMIAKVRFDDNMRLFEDEVFTCAVMKEEKKACFLRKPLYNYICAEASSLARCTHQNYPSLCDKVFRAWKNLLGESKGCDFLQHKAKHMQKVCKYYGLERDVDMKDFFQKLSKCRFIKEYASEDLFISAIQAEKWSYVIWEIVVYKVKQLFSKLAHR